MEITRITCPSNSIKTPSNLIFITNFAYRHIKITFTQTKTEIFMHRVGNKVEEHGKKVFKSLNIFTGAFTRAEKTKAAGITNKPAIMDHECNKTQAREAT